MYQGLTNRGLGSANLYEPTSNLLVVTNLGSGGQDGLSVALPANLAHFVMSCPPSSGTNPPPIGAYFQAQVVGMVNGGANGLLAALTVTRASGGNYQISASYAPLGVSTVTVQAFYNGVLTAQTTGQAGPVIASCTASPDTFDLGGIEAGSVDFHNLTNLVTLAAGLTAVPCDHLIVSPENAPPGILPTAFQVVASGVPAFTIASETATVANPVGSNSLVFQGITNWGVGNATLAVSGGELYVTNLGSSGQDGVSFAWPANVTALVVDLSQLDAAGTLPVGSYIEDSVVGYGNDVTDGSLGYLNFTKITANTIAMSANFSAIGVSSCVVQAYQAGVLVAQVTNTGPAGSILMDLPGWPGQLDYEVLEVVPPHWTAELNPNTMVEFPGGQTVTCDQIAVTPEYLTQQGPPLAFQITASQVPVLMITNADLVYQGLTNIGNGSLVYQGLTNTGHGNATLAVSGNQLYVTNLGSSGQDGVTITVPTNLTVLEVEYQPLDVSNALPVGAYLQEQIIGTTAGISNGVVGTVTVTKECGDCGGSNYVLSADYGPIGASTFTVQASLNGVLVAQAAKLNGALLAELPVWPASSDMDPYKTDTETVDFGPNPISVWLGGASAAVVCDHLYIIPENVTNVASLTAFAITASQIPVINITSENASLVFQGLTNTSLGQAALVVSTNKLVIANLGSSGQDGVRVSLNPGGSFAGGWEELDPSNTLPVGAFVESQLIGNAAGITNGVLGTTICTKAGTSNFVVTVDYSPLGASTHTVQVYNGSTLVAQVTGQTGTLCATLKLPPWICTINPFLNNDWPTGTEISINGGPTVTGTELLMIPDGGEAIGSASAVQIFASQIPSITITNEVETPGENPSLVYQGITNRGLGNATLVYWPAVSTNELVLSNLGSSGQDGVAVALPAGPGGVVVNWLPLDVSNALPVNAYIQEQVIGTANGVVNGPLDTVTVTKTGTSNYVVSADFSPIGAGTFTLQAFLNGVLVAQMTGQDKAALTSVGMIPFPDISYQPYPPPPTLKVSQHLTTAQTTLLAGQTVTWDTLYLIPNVALNGAPTALEITASGVPTITVTHENESVLYNNLINTSLGDAALAEVGGYLVIANLGSSGQDGVALSSGLAQSYAAAWQNLDPGNSLAAGAYVQSQLLGTAGAVTNGLLGTSQCLKTASDDWSLTANFSPVGASTETIEIYNGSNLVARLTGQSGTLCTMPFPPGDGEFPGPTFPNPPDPDPSPFPDPFPSGDGGTVIGWTWPGPLLITVGTTTVTGDSVYVRAEGAPSLGSLSGVQLVSSGISTIIITNETWFPAVGAMHAAELNYLTANDPLPTNFAGRLTGAQFVNILNVESNFLVGAGVNPSYVSEGITACLEDETNLGMFYVAGGQTYYGSPVPTADWPAYAVSRQVAQGVMTTKLAAQINYVAQLAASGAAPGAVLQYVTNNLINQGWTPSEQQQSEVFASVFVGSFNYWNGQSPWGAEAAGLPWQLEDALGGVDGVEDGLEFGIWGCVIGAVIEGGVASWSAAHSTIVVVQPQPTSHGGFTNQVVGNSALDVQNGNLIVEPLSTGTPYGVGVSLPAGLTAFAAGWQDLDDSNTLPVGAYLQAQAVGLASGITNGPLGTLMVRKAGKENFVVTADFSPLEASYYTVLALSNGVVVAQITNQAGVSVGIANEEAIGFGVEAAGSPKHPDLQINWPAGTQIALTSGPTVVGDTLLIRPQNAAIAGTPTSLQITAYEVPALTVIGMNVMPMASSISRAGQNVTLQWLGTSGLQESADLSHWSSVGGATSPYTVQAVGSVHFYSLVPAIPPIVPVPDW